MPFQCPQAVNLQLFLTKKYCRTAKLEPYSLLRPLCQRLAGSQSPITYVLFCGFKRCCRCLRVSSWLVISSRQRFGCYLKRLRLTQPITAVSVNDNPCGSWKNDTALSKLLSNPLRSETTRICTVFANTYTNMLNPYHLCANKHRLRCAYYLT